MNETISIVGHAAIDMLFGVENIALHNESYPIIDYNQYYGGGAANIAMAVAVLGGKAQLISAVGGDFGSSGYESELERNGVDLSLLYRFPEEKSTRAFVFTDRGQNQSTYFHWGASEKLKRIEPDGVDFVHLATSDSTYNARIAKKAGFVSFDPGQDLITYSKENLENILDNTDILFANKHEIERVCNMTGKKMEDIVNMIETVIVTYDASGSCIYNSAQEIRIPVVAVKAIDPTGAGDAYRAGFLLACTRKYSLETCGKIGSTVASFAVEKIGCQTNLPTWEKMKTRYEEYFGALEEL